MKTKDKRRIQKWKGFSREEIDKLTKASMRQPTKYKKQQLHRFKCLECGKVHYYKVIKCVICGKQHLEHIKDSILP